MKAFEFDHRVVAYARFSRSFSTIRSADLKSEIDRQYDVGRFWPDLCCLSTLDFFEVRQLTNWSCPAISTKRRGGYSDLRRRDAARSAVVPRELPDILVAR
jgi:hypothetical protein